MPVDWRYNLQKYVPSDNCVTFHDDSVYNVHVDYCPLPLEQVALEREVKKKRLDYPKQSDGKDVITHQ